MKTINQLCDIGSYRFQVKKYVFTQGTAKEEGLSRVTSFILWVSAFFAFFRG